MDFLKKARFLVLLSLAINLYILVLIMIAADFFSKETENFFHFLTPYGLIYAMIAIPILAAIELIFCRCPNCNRFIGLGFFFMRGYPIIKSRRACLAERKVGLHDGMSGVSVMRLFQKSPSSLAEPFAPDDDSPAKD